MSNVSNEKIKQAVERHYFQQCEPGKYTTEIVIAENKQHREDVKEAGAIAKSIFNYQIRFHDMDKNDPNNAEVLCRALNEGDFKDWNQIHCMNQHHHYQWFFNPENKEEATLFDVLECCCDSVAARLRRTGSVATREEEYEIFKAQGFDEYWANLMANTFMKIQTLMVENFDFDEDAMSVYGVYGGENEDE